MFHLCVVAMRRLCILTMLQLRSVLMLRLRIDLPSRCSALAMQCLHLGTLPRCPFAASPHLRVGMSSRRLFMAAPHPHVGTLPRHLIVTPPCPPLPDRPHRLVLTPLTSALPSLRIERCASSLHSIAASPRRSAPRNRCSLVAHAVRNAEELDLAITQNERQQLHTPVDHSPPIEPQHARLAPRTSPHHP